MFEHIVNKKLVGISLQKKYGLMCGWLKIPGWAGRMRRRHRRADGLDGQLDAWHPSQRLERRGDAGGGGRAQSGGDGSGDGGDGIGREPVVRLQPLRDQVRRVAAVVGQQVGLVVLSCHCQLRLKPIITFGFKNLSSKISMLSILLLMTEDT